MKFPALTINGKGQCPNCLVKPLPYRREGNWFCMRCCRSYDMKTGEQLTNWAWRASAEGGFFRPAYEPNTEKQSGQYVLAKPSTEALRRTAR